MTFKAYVTAIMKNWLVFRFTR